MKTKTEIRLGVDIGGTFTDVVVQNGRVMHSAKVLTTYDAPEEAILDGIQQVCRQAAIAPSDIASVIHGTTLATNALIERNGANTALITTDGFRDVIEMRSESRFEQYDLNITLPPPLIARENRLVVDGRIGAQGQELQAMTEQRLSAVVAQIAERGFESIAVGLIHSYANNSHENRVRDAILRAIPGADVSLSCEVSPQMREYERFNTVCANAYVKPLMKSYLYRLVNKLNAIGLQSPVFLMHSGGGIISLDDAAQFPVRLVESGPAGGAIFAAHIAGQYGEDKVLSFDMGGTTAKICLIRNQSPKTSRVFEVARTYRFKKGSGMPISIPVIDMVEIGAGGGSLASLDSLQQIRVGPRSAGSTPGPACYSRGGLEPAVTDADLILGRLDAANFAGGTMPLSTDAAARALRTTVGDPLAMDVTTAAFGVSEVVDENMANAARVHAVENGEDLTTYSMIAFGGAAPLHAARLCEKLGINRLLIPPGAGVGSAIGFLRAPFSFEATRSTYMRLSTFDSAKASEVFAALAVEAQAFVRSCDAHASIACHYRAFMRYAGQGWEIPVDLDAEDADQPDVNRYRTRFEATYVALFGRIVEGLEIEIASWSVNATTPSAAVQRVQAPATLIPVAPTGQRALHNGQSGEMVNAAVFERTALVNGAHLVGPAVVTEDETTIIVPDGFEALMQADGCLLVQRCPTA
ncbi:MAG: hydantoinase/oxoprolinase family protein [Burkholderiaceae bacterium]